MENPWEMRAKFDIYVKGKRILIKYFPLDIKFEPEIQRAIEQHRQIVSIHNGNLLLGLSDFDYNMAWIDTYGGEPKNMRMTWPVSGW